jgi:hypothetical protein
MIAEGLGQTIKVGIFFSQNVALWKNSDIGKMFGQLWKSFTLSDRKGAFPKTLTRFL